MDLDAGFADLRSGMSMYVVARPAAVQPSAKLVSLGNGPAVDNVVLSRSGSDGLMFFTDGSPGNGVRWFTTNAALVSGEAAVVSVQQAAGAANAVVAASVAKNGQTVGSGQVFVPPVVERTRNYLAKSFWNEPTLNGDIAEVLIYSRALSAAEQTQVQQYLTTKYGI